MDPSRTTALKVKKETESTGNSSLPGWKGFSFLGEVKGELNKINWTSPEELKSYTKIVVAATFLCGLAIYAVDLTLRTFLVSLEGIFRWIAG